MKLWTVFSLFLLICLIPASLPQDYDDTRLVNAEGWRSGVNDEIIEKRDEDIAEEDETTKRTRPRGGKRRRRLRKRPRTTEAPNEEVKEALTGAEQTPQEYYDQRRIPEAETTPEPEEQPKRRPSKRRRRPTHRRYQDTDHVNEGDEEVPKPPRRRRKGGRKRIRPVEVEELPETTVIPEIPESPSETSDFLEEKPKEIITTTTPTTTTIMTTTTTTTTTEIPIIYEDVSENAVIKQDTEEKEFEGVTTKYILPQRTRHYVIKNTIKPTTAETEVNDEKGYGNKIFDRRNLFSKSRRLPETSAILRRRLVPSKTEAETFNLRIINPLANLESDLDHTQSNRNEVTSKINVPDGVTARPEIISPKTLLEKIKQSTLRSTSTTEEPNYPKFESQKESIRKSIRHTTEPTVQKQETTKQAIILETTTEIKEDVTEVPEEITKKGKVSTETIFEKLDGINEKWNLTNLNDSILELLKTEGTRISKILELRNMTLNQLLEHRERGSSKFHLSDMFGSKNDNKKEKEPTSTTEKMNEKSVEIQFPDEKILGSFPKFLSDQIEKHTQHQIKEKNDERMPQTDHREPRLFESMPEFTTKSQETTKPSPTWRIIPNPRLTPVSVQGNFEEIKITDIKTGNDIEDIYLIEDNELVHQKHKVSDSLSAETVKSKHNHLSPFKRIPVSVKSAIIISAAILALAIFGFLSVLISCRVRQKKARLRAKQDILCEHLQNEDFMTSQQSLSPVLNKHQRGPVFTQGIHSNTASNRHYYLWRTLRKTFQYD